MKETYTMPNGSKLHMWGNKSAVQVVCDSIYAKTLIDEIKKQLEKK